MEARSRRLEAIWRLDVGAGGWRLEVGGWRLEAGGWRKKAFSLEKIAFYFRKNYLLQNSDNTNTNLLGRFRVEMKVISSDFTSYPSVPAFRNSPVGLPRDCLNIFEIRTTRTF